MKKFISKILAIILPLLLIGSLLEFSLRKIPNDYSYKKEYLDFHSNEIETLILGSSHSFYGVNPIYFSGKSFNASHVSQSLNYDLEILKLYNNKLTKLKTVLLPVSYFSFFSRLEDGVESWRVHNYTINYGIDNTSSIMNNSILLSNKIKINGDNMIKYFIHNKSMITCSKLGWGTLHDSIKNRDIEITGKNAALRHTKKSFNHLKGNIKTLKSIIENCNNNDIEVILFTPPAYKTYRDNLNKKQLKITFELLEELDKNYPNVKYFNFLNNQTFKSDDFHDADHLNKIGAKKLSNLLKKYVDINKVSAF